MSETKNVSVLFYKNFRSSFLHDSNIWLWGFFTLLVALAHGAAWRGDACLRLLERGEHTTKDCITKDLSTFVDYLAHLSRNNCLRSNLFHEVVTPSSSLESRNINALGSSWKCKFQSCFLWLGLLWYQLKCIWYDLVHCRSYVIELVIILFLRKNIRFNPSPQLPGAGRAWHHHGSATTTFPRTIYVLKSADGNDMLPLVYEVD